MSFDGLAVSSFGAGAAIAFVYALSFHVASPLTSRMDNVKLLGAVLLGFLGRLSGVAVLLALGAIHFGAAPLALGFVIAHTVWLMVGGWKATVSTITLAPGPSSADERCAAGGD